MIVYVFPGQGAQFPNMGANLDTDNPSVGAKLKVANDILGFDLYQLMLEGTEEELKQTHVTQPALYVHSILRLESHENPLPPALVAGHSLGEFSALVAAGALTFDEGLELVKERSAAMKAACDETPGTMAAILGLEDHLIEDICRDTQGIVVPANFNSPGQVVISGEIEAVEEAGVRCSEAGARRVVPLVVGGAFHSPLMASAQDRLSAQIHKMSFKTPSCPIVQNYDGKPSQDLEKIKEKLLQQLTAPVRWTEIMNYIVSQEPEQVYEVGGNGKVLRGLFRRVDRKLIVDSI